MRGDRFRQGRLVWATVAQNVATATDSLAAARSRAAKLFGSVADVGWSVAIGSDKGRPLAESLGAIMSEQQARRPTL